MWAEAAMHGDAGYRLVGPVAGKVAGHEFDEARREQSHRAEMPALQHHLVERLHRARGGEPAAARKSGGAHLGAVVARRIAVGAERVGATVLLLRRHADKEV